MKKRLNVTLVVVSAVVIVALGVFTLLISGLQIGFPTEYYIFSDISECDNLLTATDETVILQIQTEQDKKLKGLVYENYRAAEYSAKELHFLIFAYEFADEDGSKAYFRNNTGKNVAWNTNYSMSSGMFGSLELVVIDDRNAYCIYSTAKDYKELEALIKESFTVDVSEKMKIQRAEKTIP